MKEYLRNQDDKCLDNEARLIIECTPDGDLLFSCDWSKDDSGHNCMGNILAIIGKDGITELIIENLKKNYEQEGDEEDLNDVIESYNTINKIYRQTTEMDDDEVVISPIEAPSYL